jgi:hypothetical protein
VRRLVLGSVLLLVAVLTACGAGEDRGGERGTDGPLRPQAGSGATVTTSAQDGRTKTVTFGLLLCSDDETQEIVLDAVRYDTVPATLPTDWSGDDGRPAIGTYLRSIPPPDGTDREILPIIGVVKAPQRLRGQVVDLGSASSVPIDRPCDGYLDDDRTWPLVELLTVITADEGGAMATRTHIDYHVGEETYTTTVDWRLAICGTAMPRGARCRR